MSIKTTTLLEGIEEREAEIKSALIALANGTNVNGEPLAKATVSTRRHHFNRDKRVLSLIKELLSIMDKRGIEELKLSDGSRLGFNQLVYPQDTGAAVVVNKGDSILALLEKYSDVKDLKSKLEKAAEKKGLKLNYTTGIID